MNHTYILSLGSNVGNRMEMLQKAIKEIKQIAEGLSYSPVYITEAWGPVKQADFYNAVIKLNSKLEPLQLLEKLKQIEYALGRISKGDQQPRSIDIDILAWEEKMWKNQELQIPHLQMHKRKFILEPLNKLMPNWKHPILNKFAFELLQNCEDSSICIELGPLAM